MNGHTRRRRVGLVLFAGMLTGILWLEMWHRAGSFPGRAYRADHNPNKFYLWSETGRFTYTYTFTYDPRAADEWLFESGGCLDRPRAQESSFLQDEPGRSIPAPSPQPAPGAPHGR